MCLRLTSFINIKLLVSSRDQSWTHMPHELIRFTQENIIQAFLWSQDHLPSSWNPSGTPSPPFLGPTTLNYQDLKKRFSKLHLVPRQHLVRSRLSARRFHRAQTMGNTQPPQDQHSRDDQCLPSQFQAASRKPMPHSCLPATLNHTFYKAQNVYNKQKECYHFHHIWGPTATSIQVKCLVIAEPYALHNLCTCTAWPCNLWACVAWLRKPLYGCPELPLKADTTAAPPPHILPERPMYTLLSLPHSSNKNS